MLALELLADVHKLLAASLGKARKDNFLLDVVVVVNELSSDLLQEEKVCIRQRGGKTKENKRNKRRKKKERG